MGVQNNLLVWTRAVANLIGERLALSDPIRSDGGCCNVVLPGILPDLSDDELWRSVDPYEAYLLLFSRVMPGIEPSEVE